LKGYISYHLEDISIKVFSVNVEIQQCADNSQTVHFMAKCPGEENKENLI